MQTAEMKIRVPLELKTWIENRSIRNHRKMNGEIVAVLSAIREAENTGDGFASFAKPSVIPCDKPLLPCLTCTDKEKAHA